MGKIVKVGLPHNLDEHDRHLFAPFDTYSLEKLKVFYLQEIFVTYSGLAIDETGLIPGSHLSYPDKQQQFVNEATYYFNQSSNDPSNLVELNDENSYLLIHHPWSSNYWHWMSEAIPRVWMVRKELGHMVLVLPEHYRHMEFISGSLSPFHFKDIFYIPFNRSLLVRNLCLPQIKPVSDSYYADDLQGIRKFYLNFVRNKNIPQSNLGRKLYLSRKKSSKRKVINEEAVEEVLLKYGFASMCNEDYNFLEQIEVFSRANCLVSIHGAGLTNMLFMKENSTILELHKKRTNTGDWHSFAFWYLSDALRFRYYHQLCDPDNAESDFFQANYHVDIDILERNLIAMVGKGC